MVHTMSGFPWSGRMFFPGRPLLPALAGIMAKTRLPSIIMNAVFQHFNNLYSHSGMGREIDPFFGQKNTIGI